MAVDKVYSVGFNSVVVQLWTLGSDPKCEALSLGEIWPDAERSQAGDHMDEPRWPAHLVVPL